MHVKDHRQCMPFKITLLTQLLGRIQKAVYRECGRHTDFFLARTPAVLPWSLFHFSFAKERKANFKRRKKAL